MWVELYIGFMKQLSSIVIIIMMVGCGEKPYQCTCFTDTSVGIFDESSQVIPVSTTDVTIQISEDPIELKKSDVKDEEEACLNLGDIYRVDYGSAEVWNGVHIVDTSTAYLLEHGTYSDFYMTNYTTILYNCQLSKIE
jgi:hypothetical protein